MLHASEGSGSLDELELMYRKREEVGQFCPEFLYPSFNMEIPVNTVDIDPALTVKDVAALLNVDQKTIYRLAQRGEIPGFKVSGSWRFQRADIVDWISTQKMITSKK